MACLPAARRCNRYIANAIAAPPLRTGSPSPPPAYLAQIASTDFDVAYLASWRCLDFRSAIISKSSPLEMESLNASFRRGALTEQNLEDTMRYPHDVLMGNCISPTDGLCGEPWHLVPIHS